MSRPFRVLVVDDEPQIRRVLRLALDSQGFDLRVAADGESALDTLRDWPPDLVVTDLSMPGVDGLELCRRIRQTSAVPIIVLSVKGEERTKVAALDAGADDYVTKPFGMDELLARVRAVFRRAPADSAQASRLTVGVFTIDIAAHTVLIAGREVRLTPKEFDLLVVPCPASRQGADASRPAGCDLGSRALRTDRVSAGVRRPAAQEDRARPLGAHLSAHRAVGGLPLRSRRKPFGGERLANSERRSADGLTSPLFLL